MPCSSRPLGLCGCCSPCCSLHSLFCLDTTGALQGPTWMPSLLGGLHSTPMASRLISPTFCSHSNLHILWIVGTIPDSNIPEHVLYGQYLYGRGYPVLSEKVDSLGNLLCVLLGKINKLPPFLRSPFPSLLHFLLFPTRARYWGLQIEASCSCLTP